MNKCVFAVFVMELLKKYSWKHVAILYDIHDVLMRVQGSALTNSLRREEQLPRPYDVSFDTTKHPDFDELLTEASQHARSTTQQTRNVCQYWMNFGKASQTVGQYWSSIGCMYRVCCEMNDNYVLICYNATLNYRDQGSFLNLKSP